MSSSPEDEKLASGTELFQECHLQCQSELIKSTDGPIRNLSQLTQPVRIQHTLSDYILAIITIVFPYRSQKEGLHLHTVNTHLNRSLSNKRLISMEFIKNPIILRTE